MVLIENIVSTTCIGDKHTTFTPNCGLTSLCKHIQECSGTDYNVSFETCSCNVRVRELPVLGYDWVLGLIVMLVW